MRKITIVLSLILVGLITAAFFTYRDSKELSYQDISIADLKQYHDENREFYLLDVHTPEQKHIEGTDAFIPFTEITENAAVLPEDKNTEIIVYCRSGSMSRSAAEDLVALGYKNVKNVIGGMNAWKDAGYDKVDYNKPFVETHNSVFDFGQIKKSDGVVSTTFELENHGKETLIIGDISTSCGCTSAEIDKKELGSDEIATLTVYFDPNFHQEPEGQFTRSVFVPTNDPDTPELQFDIKVEILE